MRKVPYYPGCALLTIDVAFDVSSKRVAQHMGTELVDIEDYNCCGIGELKSQGDAGMMLPARNMMLAKKQFQAGELVMSCSVCYHELSRANNYIRKDSDQKARVNEMLNRGGEPGYEGDVEPRHFLEYLYNEHGLEAIRAKVTRPLKGLKVAPYYGCLYTRPSQFTGAGREARLDHPERPRFMHDILEACGAETVAYGNEVSCCGGRNLVQDEDTSFRLIYDTLSKAKAAGADLVALICPKCAGGLDIMQEKVLKAAKKRERGSEERAHIPVVYLTQLIGLAFGESPNDVRLRDMETPGHAVLAAKVWK